MSIKIKVAVVGDANVGKTSLMVKYTEGIFDKNYIQTLGVNCMEKQITLKGKTITFLVNDLGGQREFSTMLPVVVENARVILFVFDLTRPISLNGVKDWFKQTRQHNTKAHYILVGTKFDLFQDLHESEQQRIREAALKLAEIMKASVVFCSSTLNINVHNIFKAALAKVLNLSLNIPQSNDGAVFLIN